MAVAEDKTRILTAEEAARLAALAEPADDRTRILSAEEAARVVSWTEPADDRTRVLSAEEAARLLETATPEPRPQPAAEDREPKLVDGKIVFFCANGHRIAVDRSLAGKRGKCSKRGCGVGVVIPKPPGLETQPEPAAEAEPFGGAPPVADARALPFPTDLGDHAAPNPVAAPATPVAGPEPASEAGPAAPGWDFGAGASAAPGAPADDVGVAPEDAAAGWEIDIDAIDNPTARLVARLWLERAHGGIVEVHLSGGSVIMPEFFDPAWSSGTHALFATAGPGETVTLTAVAWDQIQKVVVRQVQGKPDGMFEG